MVHPHKAKIAPQSILWIIAWSFSFCTSMSIAKFLSCEISIVVLVSMRLLFGAVFFSPMYFKNGIKPLKTKRLPLHMVRIVLSLLAMLCTYYGYSNLPLAMATSIGFTAPLITAILAVFLLGDRLDWSKWALIILGYLGVLIMVRPQVLDLGYPAIITVLANLFASCAIITAKKLSDTEPPVRLLFFTNFISLGIIAPIAFFMWKTPTLNDIMLIAVLGVTGTLSQYCYLNAIKRSSPALVAPFEYTRLVIAVPIGILFFSEIPTVWTIAGSLLIITTTFLLSLYGAGEKKLATIKEKI